MRKKAGVVLLLAGTAVLAAWASWSWNVPLEEPANPGKTPNPSKTPWTYSPWDPIEWRLYTYGPPAAAGTLLLAGALLLGRRRSSK